MTVLNTGWVEIDDINQIGFNDRVKVSEKYLKKVKELGEVEENNICKGHTFLVRGIINIKFHKGLTTLILQRESDDDRIVYFKFNDKCEIYHLCPLGQKLKGIKVLYKDMV